MKQIIMLTILALLCAMVYGVGIGEITSFTNGKMLFEHDEYDGQLLIYENRLITQNMYSIQEFEMLPDGHLERISFFENKLNLSVFSTIEEDKYYHVWMSEAYMTFFLTVYDLSVKPMQMLINMNTGVEREYICSYFFTDEHLVLSDSVYERSMLINKNTFTIDGYIDGLDGSYMRKIGNYLLIPATNVSGYLGWTLMFYKINDIYNNDIELISTLIVPDLAQGLIDIIVEDSIITIAAVEGIAIIDIEDIYNPILLHEVETPLFNHGTLLTDDYLFTINNNAIISIYKKNISENYILEHTINNHTSTLYNKRLLQYVPPYLYANRGRSLNVYDISNNYQEVFTLGNYLHDTVIAPLNNDLYYVVTDRFYNYAKIYSLFENELVCTLEYDPPEKELYRNWFVDFDIIDDMLYAFIGTLEGGFLGIYRIEDKEAQLISKTYIGGAPNHFKLIQNRLYFSELSDMVTLVYDLVDNELIYHGSFPGIINHDYNTPKNVILNYFNNNLYLRDVFDYTEYTMLPMPSESMLAMVSIDDNYFLTHYFSGTSAINKRQAIYKYSAENTFLNVHQDLFGYSLFTHGGYIVNAVQGGNTEEKAYISSYYKISNGELVQIGEKYDERNVSISYIFPERHKMYQLAGSGVWEYDMQYTVSEVEKVEDRVETSGLRGNYPNPFNPNTRISFFVASKGQVQIDVFNIRGQKIKSLVNDFYNVGHHNVTWNGTDDNGSVVSSGVYLYRMQIGDFSETRRMVMMK